MTRYLADTSVLVYAAGGPHRYRDSCRAIVERISGGSLELEASVDLVQEYAHVQLRSGRERAFEVAQMCRLHAVEPGDAILMLDLLARSDRLDARDALFAATALNRGIDAILSSDRDFDGIAGLERVDPGELPR